MKTKMLNSCYPMAVLAERGSSTTGLATAHVPCPMSWLFCYPLRDGKASEIEIGQGLGE